MHASGASADVTLEGVSKLFGPIRALVGVTASFSPGEVCAVLGANGAGKSTLLAMLGGMARPTSGVIRFGTCGEDRAAVRRVLGWVGHESLCYGDLTGRENVEFAARLHGVPPEDAWGRAVARFGLDGFGERPVRSCSRGQRQKVALARALVHLPSLILLDEPTTGLDDAGTERLAGVVAEESRRGALVVVVTHDASFAGRVAGRTLRLDKGRLVAAPGASA